MENVETVIVGAGQAGLATVQRLRMRGRECVVLDHNQRIGDGWRRQWDSLRLYSPAKFDPLPGMRFPADPWSFPTKDDVAAYLEAYRPLGPARPARRTKPTTLIGRDCSEIPIRLESRLIPVVFPSWCSRGATW